MYCLRGRGYVDDEVRILRKYVDDVASDMRNVRRDAILFFTTMIVITLIFSWWHR